jgi:hypothetical protein
VAREDAAEPPSLPVYIGEVRAEGSSDVPKTPVVPGDAWADFLPVSKTPK